MKKYLVLLVIFGLILGSISILPVLAEDPNSRTGQNLGSGASPTAQELSASILTFFTAPFLVSASKTGPGGQFEVYTTSLQSFPTNGSSWALISTGKASSIAGEATTFYSYNTGGPTSPPYSHRGYPSYDIATLSLTLSVPAGATLLSFDWKFGTEENPTYISSYVDWARAIVITSAGSTNILLFPDDKPVDVDNAVPFSNAVTGSSTYPGPPYPSPNDVVYNAVTEMYTSTFNIAPFVGETITIDFQVGDENDQILDSALFVDNVSIIPKVPEKMIKPVEGYFVSPWGRFNFGEDVGYENHRGIDIDGEIEGDDVLAPVDGEVVYVKRKVTSDAGLWVWIWHGDISALDDAVEEKISTRYLHLAEIPDEIVPGAKVYKGETIIGKVGDTGREYWDYPESPAHLHFEVWQGGDLDIIKSAIALGTIPGRLWNSDTDPGKELKVLYPLHFVTYEDKPGRLTIAVFSPVDLVVTDPDGFTISKDVNELLTKAWYFEYGIEGEEGPHGVEFVTIDDRKIGDYLITVIPEPDALPTDSYTLESSADGITATLTKNVPIGDIPRVPYILRSTETELIPIIPAFVDFDPDTLSLKSKGKHVTTYIELPIGYDVNEINLGSVRLNEQISIEPKPTEIGDYDQNDIPDLMVKFSRSAIQNILEPGDEVKIVITGKMIDESPFQGSDAIRVMERGKKK